MAIALAIGLIIGIERGWQQRDVAEGKRSLGLRTHALAGLLGGVWGAIVRGQGSSGLVALSLTFLVFASVSSVFRLREVRHQQTFGATTIVAAMLAFSLGALAVIGDSIAASAAGVVTACILALKPALHSWVTKLTWQELRAGLLLLAMTVILLPVLPDRELGPLTAFNPHELWLMTVLIAVVSFAGYVAVKVAGDQMGVLLAGLAGGLVSSTAVTLSMARLAKQNEGKVSLYVSGALFANVTMMLRVLVITSVFNSQISLWLAPPLICAALSQGGVAWYLLNRNESDSSAGHSVSVVNPFELQVLLSFGALLALIGFLAKIALGWAGSRGVFALAAASGIADVDAITLSMARLARSELGSATASQAILLAVAVNTGAKAVLAWFIGGRRIGRGILFASFAALSFGLIGREVALRIFPLWLN